MQPNPNSRSDDGLHPVLRCPLCGSDGLKPWAGRGRFTLLTCRQCGLGICSPQCSEGDFAAGYKDGRFSPVAYYQQIAADEHDAFADRLKKIAALTPGRKLLDVGCNIGTLLSAAKDVGFDALGIDINPEAIRYAVETGRLQAECKTIESLAGSLPFDAVTAFDVVEHLPDPRNFIRQAAALTAAGGILCLTTPDLGAMVPRITRGRWLHFKPLEHLCYFNQKTIKTLLADEFELISIESVARKRSIRIIAEKLKSYSSLLSAVMLALPNWLLDRRISLNPGDEMLVIARKKRKTA